MATFSLPFVDKAEADKGEYKYIDKNRDDFFWKYICNKLPERGVWLS